MEEKCPKCGNLFDCQKDEDSCWCSTYTPLKKEQIVEGIDCFCKNCLKRVYFEKLFPEN